jgi:hypothetical protein
MSDILYSMKEAFRAAFLVWKASFMAALRAEGYYDLCPQCEKEVIFVEYGSEAFCSNLCEYRWYRSVYGDPIPMD